MPSYTLTECLDRFMKDSRHHASSTSQRNNGAVKNLNTFFNGLYLNGQFRVIDGAEISRYREWRKTVPLPPRNTVATPQTIKRELAVASAAINYCRSELNWDIPNPITGRMMSRQDKRAETKRKRFMTPSEEAAVLLASPPILRDIVQFALLTGFRQGEILSLTWERIIGDVVIFTPEDQKSRRFGKRVLSPDALAIVDRQPEGHSLVFHQDGQKIRKETLNRWWRKAKKLAGVDDIRFHDTRGTAGQKMLNAGASIEGVSAQFGHGDVRTTQSYYVDPSLERARDAVNRIAVRGP